MFASTELAARIEAAEASLSADVGHAVLARGRTPDAFVEPVGGGVAVFAGPRSPVNKLIGAGFAGAPHAEHLDLIERRFAERAAPLQAEVSTLADASWHQELGHRHYAIMGFENVLGLSLGQAEPAGEAGGPVSITVCQPGEDATWIDVVAEGFAAPDDVPAQAAGQDHPREAIVEVFDNLMAAGGFVRYLAWLDGVVAGGASLRMYRGIAQFCGAATRPAFRRRGVQSALFGARIRAAAGLGCDLAIVTTAPGSKSMENAQRRGFSLLYARALHVRVV